MKRLFPLLICIVLAFPSCENRREGGFDTSRLVPVQLALQVGGDGKAQQAKGNASVITEMDQGFRGIEDVTLVPFADQRPVQEGDRSIYRPGMLPAITTLVANNHAHLYPSEEVFLPGGTASLLAYGRTPEASAATETDRLHLNGALVPHGLSVQPTLCTAGEIGFSPVPICADGFPTEAARITDILSEIVGQASRTTTYFYYELGAWKSAQVAFTWNETVGELQLRNYFDWITNGGLLTTGAGRNVEFMLTRLYVLLKDYADDDTTPYEHVNALNRYPAYKTMGPRQQRLVILHGQVHAV